jgi:hypothetical protein
MTDKTDAEMLADTRRYIEQHGWVQGTMRNDDGKVCGYGGLALSQGWMSEADDEPIDADLQERARVVLGKVLLALGWNDSPDDLSLSDFTSWNDDAVESEQEILDAFAKAEKIELAGYDPDAT